ncbi:MAG TPA: 30S ribosomal protein S9 [Candidatus Saccharimonadales bacterium]|nr:30S ribosomal protein S9 [Candidatus Saccharimonadales bacterium]
MAEEQDTKQEENKTLDKKPKGNFFLAHGRRKGAVARIRLFKGKGEMMVNNNPMFKYFPALISKEKLQKPFRITKSEGQYYATVRVNGSGKMSQIDAIVQGLSKALTLAAPEFRSTLKKAGLLTRDARVRERRKYGRAQKARKGKQSPKR